MKDKKLAKMTRAQAGELYKELRRSISAKEDLSKVGSEKNANASNNISRSLRSKITNNSQQEQAPKDPTTDLNQLDRRPIKRQLDGKLTALVLVSLCAALRVGIGALEHFGVVGVKEAQASISSVESEQRSSLKQDPKQGATKIEEQKQLFAIASSSSSAVNGQFNAEQVRVLNALDQRRVELEEQRDKLENRAFDLDRREGEMETQLTELRSLTERLKLERVQDQRKREGQLEQLSKVYSSMNPEEAAKLIEQLDSSIALSLIERMPEKRIGQILALMSAEKALSITRMLTGG